MKYPTRVVSGPSQSDSAYVFICMLGRTIDHAYYVSACLVPGVLARFSACVTVVFHTGGRTLRNIPHHMQYSELVVSI